MSKNTKELAVVVAKVVNSTFQAIKDKDSSNLGKIQYYVGDLFATGAAFEWN